MAKSKLHPVQEVENWKDVLYSEIKDLHGKILGDYLKQKAELVLKEHGITRRLKYPVASCTSVSKK